MRNLKKLILEMLLSNDIFRSIFFRYVGLCAGIKILALALFLVDWWLVRRRRQMEDQAPSFTVNEFVGSIISLDKCK